jgi:hypothetical protein
MKGAMTGILSGAYPTREISPRLKQMSERKNMFILRQEKSQSISEQSNLQYLKLFQQYNERQIIKSIFEGERRM